MTNPPSASRSPSKATLIAAGVLAAVSPSPANASVINDAKIVAALDDEFQAAVKRNDADTMGRILTDDAVLVTGRGAIFTREQQLESARTKERSYAVQDEEPGTQSVRVWGDTAVVTALLAIKGVTQNGQAFDYRLWFSDTYVRTPTGWRYAFGQASLPLPQEPVK